MKGENILNSLFYEPVRKTKAMVSFSMVAPEAKEKATVGLPSENAFSRGAQIIDNVTDITARVATFEPDYWRLDGSFVLPVTPETSEMEVGFWGNKMSGENGYFTEIPTITITFEETQNIPKLGIAFDEPANEFITELEILAYNGLGVLIYNEKINDNKSAYATSADGIMGVYKIVIKLYRTNKPLRFPRVSEIDFGVIIKFGNDDIFDLSLITEGDPKGGRFPNSSFSLKIANKGRFDQLDSKSLAQYLYKRQAFEYKHGVEDGNGATKWVYCGAYYLDNWSVSDNEVNFSAVGKSSVLDKKTYYHSTFQTDTVGHWIKSILERAGFDHVIAPILDNSPPITGFFGNVTYREALAYLTEISGCLAYEDKQNTIRFVDTLGEFEAVDRLDYNNMLSTPKVKLESYYNGINLTEYSVSVKNGQLARTDISVDKSADITVCFEKPLYRTPAYTLTAGFALSNIVYNTMFMTATITGNGVATLTVTGDMAETVKSETFYPAPWFDPKEPVFAYTVDLPMMIVAQDYPAFRDWFLKRKFALLQKRLTCDIAWRQNPEREVGDKIFVQVNKKNQEIPMVAYEQTIEFSGGVLSGKTKTFGDVRLNEL